MHHSRGHTAARSPQKHPQTSLHPQKRK
uniref:Uncharacterized protein n=1 Tax=Anguilla anguilla TaxID=7936 RepID=A0A0E9QFH0_ANGAN